MSAKLTKMMLDALTKVQIAHQNTPAKTTTKPVLFSPPANNPNTQDEKRTEEERRYGRDRSWWQGRNR